MRCVRMAVVGGRLRLAHLFCEMGSLSLRFRTLERCQSNTGGGGRRNGVDDALVARGGISGRSCPALIPALRLETTWAVIDYCLYGWRKMGSRLACPA
jgi:hypothetical protein